MPTVQTVVSISDSQQSQERQRNLFPLPVPPPSDFVHSHFSFGNRRAKKQTLLNDLICFSTCCLKQFLWLH